MSEELSANYASNNDARVIREWEVRSYLGKILTIIDGIGLPERQDKAVKDLIKQATWGELWYTSSYGYTIIRTDEADKLLMKAIEKQQEIDNDPRSHTASVPPTI